jgi:hypothetical protein
VLVLVIVLLAAGLVPPVIAGVIGAILMIMLRLVRRRTGPSPGTRSS